MIRYSFVPRENTYFRYTGTDLELLIRGHWRRVGDRYPIPARKHLVPDLALLLIGASIG